MNIFKPIMKLKKKPEEIQDRLSILKPPNLNSNLNTKLFNRQIHFKVKLSMRRDKFM